MRIPIRIIGIATSVFWVFLIIFAASAMYSMKDFQFNFGQPQISTTEDDELLFSFPISIVNTGLYNLANFNTSTKISDEEGSVVAQGSTLIPLIGRGEAISITHNMKLNLTDLLQTHQSFLFNDTELKGNLAVNMRTAEVIPVQASSNFSMPWGAPLYNLTFGVPQFARYNTSHARVTVPTSFENHAFFDLSGTVQVRMYNRANALIGQSQTNIEVPQHSPYNGNLELYVPLSAASRVRFEVFFVTPFFNYGPLVISYGG